MAIAHLYLANLGLAGLVFGFLTPRLGGWPQAVGGSLYALGALLWVGNLWRTFNTAHALSACGQSGQQLPTVDQ